MKHNNAIFPQATGKHWLLLTLLLLTVWWPVAACAPAVGECPSPPCASTEPRIDAGTAEASPEVAGGIAQVKVTLVEGDSAVQKKIKYFGKWKSQNQQFYKEVPRRFQRRLILRGEYLDRLVTVVLRDIDERCYNDPQNTCEFGSIHGVALEKAERQGQGAQFRRAMILPYKDGGRRSARFRAGAYELVGIGRDRAEKVLAKLYLLPGEQGPGCQLSSKPHPNKSNTKIVTMDCGGQKHSTELSFCDLTMGKNAQGNQTATLQCGANPANSATVVLDPAKYKGAKGPRADGCKAVSAKPQPDGRVQVTLQCGTLTSQIFLAAAPRGPAGPEGKRGVQGPRGPSGAGCTVQKTAGKPGFQTTELSCASSSVELYEADTQTRTKLAGIRSRVRVRNKRLEMQGPTFLTKAIGSLQISARKLTVDKANLQVKVSTSSARNQGNVFVGYNAGSSTLQRQGTHNLVIGDGHEYSSAGGVLIGKSNSTQAADSSILGGTENKVPLNSPGSSILGGRNNQVMGLFSCISGGRDNQTLGNFSSLLGGRGSASKQYPRNYQCLPDCGSSGP